MNIWENISSFDNAYNTNYAIPILKQSTSPCDLYQPNESILLPKIIKSKNKHLRQLQDRA